MASLSELVRAQLEQDPWWMALQQQKGGVAGGKPVGGGPVTAPAFGPPTEEATPFFRDDKAMELAARLRATAGVAKTGGIRGVGAGTAATVGAGARSHKGGNLHYIKGTNRYVDGAGEVWRRNRRGRLERLGGIGI